MSTKKTIRSLLKDKANDFTNKLSSFIEKTDWNMGAETVTINPNKLDKTKVKIEFEISSIALEDIKNEVNSQTSLTAYATKLEDPLKTEEE